MGPIEEALRDNLFPTLFGGVGEARQTREDRLGTPEESSKGGE